MNKIYNKNRKEIYKIFEENAGKIITAKEIIQATGINPITTRVILRRLTDAGSISRVARGKYTLPASECKITIDNDADAYKITIDANGNTSRWEINRQGEIINQAWNSDFVDAYNLHFHQTTAKFIAHAIKHRCKFSGSGLMDFIEGGQNAILL